ncbi:EAL domain-containing protein [Hydrogenobacter sp. T-2]|uniref:EAL domain-containing protein n=1 Tax=Pampinifervens diazotrophicum TaxID=1632018 RepID=UPI002B25A90D|nr:EAL domain-containing protein [Hydrogenobacter sp. T-2]WPM31669.1 EAL domain-containing protein [Hydrogenobacter sp. T-2]
MKKLSSGISFSVCPHDTEKGIKRWQEFAKRLELAIGQRVNFEVLSGHEEEYKRIEKGEFFDLYYAGPLISPRLYELGYIPVAKFKGQKDKMFLVERKIPEEGHILVATPFLRPSAYSFLDLDIERVKVVLVNNFYEAFRALKEGRVHACIMYNETWEEIEEEEKKLLVVVEEHVFETSHLFMAKPEVYSKVRDALLSFEEIEPADESDVSKVLKLFKEFDKFMRLWSKASFFHAIDKAKHVGVLLYTKKIEYVNDCLAELLGYSKEELEGMDSYTALQKFFPIEYRKPVEAVVTRRLSGEDFSQSYDELPLLRKDGSTVWTIAFSETVLYEGSYAGLVFFVDITEKKKAIRFYRLLIDLIENILKAQTEEEALRELCIQLTKNMSLKLVWVGIPDYEKELIVPVYSYGQAEEYLKDLTISTREDLPEGQGVTARAYRENKIYINENTLKNPTMTPWREKQLKFGILSSCAIPIVKDEKVEYVINLYAGEPYFFSEESTEVLYEIKNAVEFILKKVKRDRESYMIFNAVEKAKSWTLITNKLGEIIYVNEAVCEISGYSKEELIGKSPELFKSGYHPPEFYSQLWSTIRAGQNFHSIFVNRGRHGQIFYLESSIHPIKLPDGSLVYMQVGRDITREVHLSSEIERLTFFDTLTGLHNLDGLRTKAEEVLKRSNLVLLALVDLCNFSMVNRLYGEMVGDTVLIEIGKRLSKYSEKQGIIARLASDEFAVFLPLKREEDAIEILKEMEETLEKSFILNGIPINPSFNIGVALYPHDGSSFGELHEKASIALSNAKRAGEGEIRFFEVGFEERIRSKNLAIELVHRAVEDDLFVFYYQPYWNSKDMKLAGFEALVRIKDKHGNVYSPALFIDYLENSRYLRSFEGIMLRHARRFYEKYKYPLSINVSARSFRDKRFIENLIDQVAYTSITVEITERIFMEGEKEVIENIEILREAGIKVALDDFGTGYSSLSYISRIPVNVIKIDISFVRGMLEDKRIRVVVENIIRLSHGLEIETIAEGVETQEQVDILRDMGCTYLQGYFLGKPMPEENIIKLISVV